VSAAGLLASWIWDLPTGAAIVSTFGALLGAIAVVLGAAGLVRAVRSRGIGAAVDVGIAASAIVGLAGLLLVIAPGMDHPWIDGLERLAPHVRLIFLDAEEREADGESRQAIAEGVIELDRARRVQQEAQWGTRPISADMQERVRQYIAGRTEMITGDRMALEALKQRARQRQRYLVGVPLTLAGFGAAALAVRARRRQGQGDAERDDAGA
jgi:zinc/manganese transport system permease protein